MIHELRIRDLGVIREAVCGFAPGFTAVTGETGAGKTMVVTGLGLLAGARADAGLVRSGCPQASVEGWFDVDPTGDEAGIVTEAGGIVDADGLTAARILASRSRSVLGGRGVPTGLMADVVGRLLVIHGQHEQVRVASRAQALLDAFAGSRALDLAQRCAAVHGELRDLTAQLEQLRTGARARLRELDMLTHSLEEIASVDPQPDEDVLLAAEAQRLAHADALVTAARAAQQAIVADAELDGPSDAMSLLGLGRRSLEAVAEHDPGLGDQARAIRSAMVQLSEVAADLAAYVADVDADPRRLASVLDRRAELARLTRKYGDDVAGVLAWSREAAARVAELSGADERIDELSEQVRQRRSYLAGIAAELHAVRVGAAGDFSERVAAELDALAMPRARVGFEVTTDPDPEGLDVPGLDGPVAFRSTGIDQVTLVLAANQGAPMRPIAQAASGGELSRVMLAIQVVLAGADPVPTMVFDEVDAGVGGSAAIEVGRRLRQLSRVTQVVVVTHLAQVAAFADRQLVVTKDTDGSVTAASVREVVGQDRVRELSRMLAGLADSRSAGEHAEELLGLAGSESQRDPGMAGLAGR